MTLKKRSTSGVGNPLWHCETCQKTYTNQAQAVTHLVRGHGMGKVAAQEHLNELKLANGIPHRMAAR